jgi:hypothetical protein
MSNIQKIFELNTKYNIIDAKRLNLKTYNHNQNYYYPVSFFREQKLNCIFERTHISKNYFINWIFHVKNTVNEDLLLVIKLDENWRAPFYDAYSIQIISDDGNCTIYSDYILENEKDILNNELSEKILLLFENLFLGNEIEISRERYKLAN